ncbi:hypothetical protein [Methylobacterium sp. WL6]|uniref:hypothetical protein n=1 Tax=Methylobacterium sp. WL6 TaxID=2603901 RepID=UPI0011C730DF|nr:hypothetical protein [Methylobacterium sp. WL6]
MANHAHSTRTPLFPQAGRQPGPVTLALRAMRTADPDQAAHDAIEAIHRGLDRHFSEADHRRLKTLRRSVADRIAADLALLDMLTGDADLEEDDHEHDPAEDGLADADGLLWYNQVRAGLCA